MSNERFPDHGIPWIEITFDHGQESLTEAGLAAPLGAWGQDKAVATVGRRPV